LVTIPLLSVSVPQFPEGEPVVKSNVPALSAQQSHVGAHWQLLLHTSPPPHLRLHARRIAGLTAVRDAVAAEGHPERPPAGVRAEHGDLLIVSDRLPRRDARIGEGDALLRDAGLDQGAVAEHLQVGRILSRRNHGGVDEEDEHQRVLGGRRGRGHVRTLATR
jgi:hypothetical protein